MSLAERSLRTAEPRSNPRSGGVIALLLWVGLLSIVAPAFVVLGVPNRDRSLGWALALAITVWAGFRLSQILAKGDARVFSFFFWLYTYVFLGLAPAIQIRADEPSGTTPDVLPSYDTVALWVVILGIVCFEAGTFIAALVQGPERAARRERRPVDGGISPGRTVLLWAIGVGVGSYYISNIGVGVLFSSRDGATSVRALLWPDPPIRTAVVALTTYPTLVALGGLTLLRRAERRLSVSATYLVMIGIAVGVLVVAINPLSAARYPLGTMAFALAVFLGAAATPQRVRITFSAVVLGLFFVFPLADAFRRGEPDFARAGLFGEYAANPDYDSIWQIANAITYWQAGLAKAGDQALGLVLFWVPRSIWPDKPLDTGVLLAEHHGYRVTNLSAPLWAEATINGGLLAVIAVFVILGYLLRRIDFRVMAAIRWGGLWFVAGGVLPAYLLIILRGSLLQATGAAVLIIACLVWIRSRVPETPHLQVGSSRRPSPVPNGESVRLDESAREEVSRREESARREESSGPGAGLREGRSAPPS